MNIKKMIIAAVLLVLLIVAPLMVTSTYYINLFSYMLIFALLAMTLDILVGYIGLTSLGHAVFFGGGAYAAGILNSNYDWSFIASSLGALVFVILLAALFGMMTTRVTGVTFIMVTLALGQVIWGLAYRWSSLTGGDNGLIGISRPEIFGYTFNTPLKFYYLLLVVCLLCAFALYRIVNSSFGLTMKGIKHSSKRMSALGYNVFNHTYLTYIISGIFAGIIGIMYAFYNGFVSPLDVNIVTSSKMLLMVLVGGTGTLFGPAIGGALIVAMENLISSFTDRWVLIMGLLYIVVVMYVPGGIIGLMGNIASLVKQDKKPSKMKADLEESTAD